MYHQPQHSQHTPRAAKQTARGQEATVLHTPPTAPAPPRLTWRGHRRPRRTPLAQPLPVNWQLATRQTDARTRNTRRDASGRPQGSVSLLRERGRARRHTLDMPAAFTGCDAMRAAATATATASPSATCYTSSRSMLCTVCTSSAGRAGRGGRMPALCSMWPERSYMSQTQPGQRLRAPPTIISRRVPIVITAQRHWGAGPGGPHEQ